MARSTKTGRAQTAKKKTARKKVAGTGVAPKQSRFRSTLTVRLSTSYMENEIRALRLRLLSQDKAVVDEARSLIDTFTRYSPSIRALGIYEAIKEWVNGIRRRPEEIQELKEAARVEADSPFGATSYQAQWTYAFALKYCREFDHSEKRYQTAASLASGDNKNDVLADLGELYVYGGYAGKAKETIEGAERERGWRPWCYAFALHQYAFEQMEVRGPDPKQWYAASNAVLTAWPDLPVNPDAQLIIAANHVGLGDRKRAGVALGRFLTVTPDWSLKREKRGPFLIGNGFQRSWIDPAPNNLASYRMRYAKHFFNNLRHARRNGRELPDTYPNDPNNPPGSDPE